MKTPRVAFGATFALGKQYVVVAGGMNKATPTPQACSYTEVFDIAKNAWSGAADMVVARSAHSMCEVGEGSHIYAFGG